MNTNNMFANGNYTPYGAIGSIYPGQPAPQPKNTQPLTDEEKAELMKQVEKFTTQITRTEMLRSWCTHRDKGDTALVQAPDGNGYICSICGERVILKDYTPEEVQAVVDEFINVINMTKVKYMDLPVDIAKAVYQILPYVNKTPQLYQLANECYAKYANGYNGNLNPVNGSPSYGVWNSFYAMQGGVPNGMNYGNPYQQTMQPGYPMMVPPQMAPMQNQMMGGMGSTIDMQRNAMVMNGNPLYAQYTQQNPQMNQPQVDNTAQPAQVSNVVPAQTTPQDNANQQQTVTTTSKVAL